VEAVLKDYDLFRKDPLKANTKGCVECDEKVTFGRTKRTSFYLDRTDSFHPYNNGERFLICSKEIHRILKT
jgi:hypothetical protein